MKTKTLMIIYSLILGTLMILGVCLENNSNAQDEFCLKNEQVAVVTNKEDIIKSHYSKKEKAIEYVVNEMENYTPAPFVGFFSVKKN